MHTRAVTLGNTTDRISTWTKRWQRTASRMTTNSSTIYALTTESFSARCTSVSMTTSPKPRLSFILRPTAFI